MAAQRGYVPHLHVARAVCRHLLVGGRVRIAVRVALAQQDAADAATVTFILTLVLAASALVYRLFAPDAPKPQRRF